MYKKTKMPEQQTYMDPFTDYGFKKLFGEEESKIFLIDFLNSVLEGFIPQIKELTYNKTEHLGNKLIDRNAVFDLYCKSPEGTSFIIELQKVKQDYFKQRSLFYSTFAIQEQAPKGIWDFKINPVYCIGILNFSINPADKKAITKAKILDIENHKTVIEELNFAFIECQNHKNINKNSSKQDKWLHVLSHIDRLHELPPELSEKIFEEFFKRANILKLPAKERAKYNASLTYSRDLHNIEAQNFAKGMKKGKIEGKIEGEAIGIQKGKLKAAQKLIQAGMDKKQIQTILELSDKDILKI